MYHHDSNDNDDYIIDKSKISGGWPSSIVIHQCSQAVLWGLRRVGFSQRNKWETRQTNFAAQCCDHLETIYHFLKVLLQLVIMKVSVCLQQSDLKENVNIISGRLRKGKQVTDVTLACGDVHKRVLQMSKNPHPLIYLKGFQSKDFLSILDFLYFGDANAYVHICLPSGSRFLFRQDDNHYIKI